MIPLLRVTKLVKFIEPESRMWLPVAGWKEEKGSCYLTAIVSVLQNEKVLGICFTTA